MVKETTAPLYQLNLNVKRILIPQIITLIFLSALFYIGILVNLSMLSLNQSLKGTIKFAGVIFIIFLILLGTFLNFLKAKHGVKFYNDHLDINHKKLPYLKIQTFEKKQNKFDEMFNTYSLKLDKKHLIDSIPTNVDIQNYLSQMINYARQLQQSQFMQRQQQVQEQGYNQSRQTNYQNTNQAYSQGQTTNQNYGQNQGYNQNQTSSYQNQNTNYQNRY